MARCHPVRREQDPRIRQRKGYPKQPNGLWSCFIKQNRHFSHLRNSRFTKRTSTNLGRSHRLPQDCTKEYAWQIWGVSPKAKWCTWTGMTWPSGIATWEGPIAYFMFLLSIAGVFAVAHSIIARFVIMSHQHNVSWEYNGVYNRPRIIRCIAISARISAVILGRVAAHGWRAKGWWKGTVPRTVETMNANQLQSK